MKVIKRDGRAVEYDRQKIVIAIEKANNEVPKGERISKENIMEIVEYIEELNKKRMLVEDIQDIIEKKLMEFNKYDVAKKYIVYRYTRALVRKQNTTDESILGLIRSNGNGMQKDEKDNSCAIVQRNYIAGEVSKDLTRRLLLPEKITNAHQEGIIYFHNSEYFIQPIINSSIINIEDMLDNGTVINGILAETPKNFHDACILTTQIIGAVSSNQYGKQYVNLMALGKYVEKSYYAIKNELEEKYRGKIAEEIIEEMIQDRLKTEITVGVQIILNQINTLISITGKAPLVTYILYLKNEDKYIKENAKIIEEILKQIYAGIKNAEGNLVNINNPEFIYVMPEEKYNYLTELARKCAEKEIRIEEITENIFEEKYKNNGEFDQGIVSINLPQIGILACGNEEKFWQELEEKLDICKEALLCRHYALLGTTSDISPIHWQNGAIARLNRGEKIDKLLVGEYSTLTLGYIGIYEATKLVKEISSAEQEEYEFESKLIKKLNDTIKKWKKETGINFKLNEINKNANTCLQNQK